MKRLRQFDFLAPPGRPWAGYALLTLAGASLVTLGWLLWMTRATDGADLAPRRPGGNPPLAMRAPVQPATGSLSTRQATGRGTPTTAGGTAQPTSQGPTGPADAQPAAAMASGNAAGSTGAAPAQAVAALQPAGDAYADAGALREQFQLRQTRAIGGPVALPWTELLMLAQAHLRNGVAILRLEPDMASTTPPSLVRLTARATDENRMRAYIDALDSDPRLHDVTLVAPVLNDLDGQAAEAGTAATRRSGGLRFSLVIGWRGADPARHGGQAGNRPQQGASRP